MFRRREGERISEDDWRTHEKKTLRAYIQFVGLFLMVVILEILYAVYILWFA